MSRFALLSVFCMVPVARATEPVTTYHDMDGRRRLEQP